MQAFVFFLVVTGVIAPQGPATQIIDLFATEQECLAAKKELDASPNNPNVAAIGSGCIQVFTINGNK